MGHQTARPLVHWATRLLGHRAVGALSQWITAQAGPKGSSAMRRFRTCAISGQVRNVTPCPWAAGPRRHWAIAPLGHCGIAGMLQLQHGSTDLPGHGAKRPGGNARSASRLREQWGTAARGRWDADQVGYVSSQPKLMGNLAAAATGPLGRWTSRPRGRCALRPWADRPAWHLGRDICGPMG